MWNRILYALAVVFGAALLSIAIAWGLKLGYLFVERPPNRQGTFVRDGEAFVYHAWEGVGQTSVTLNHEPHLAPAAGGGLFEDRYTDFEIPRSIVVLATGADWHVATGTYGLPFRCMRNHMVVSAWTTPQSVRRYEQWVVTESLKPFGRSFSVPLKPLWPGLLANTAFWSVAIVAARFVPAQIRSLIRRYRGRCPACGYDLKDELAKGCSECGWGKNQQDREGAVRHDSHV